MVNPFEKTKTPAEMAEIQKNRAISDAELLNKGAEYKSDKEGNIQLEATDEQIDVARKEMESDSSSRDADNEKEAFVSSLVGQEKELFTHYQDILESHRQLEPVLAKLSDEEKGIITKEWAKPYEEKTKNFIQDVPDGEKRREIHKKAVEFFQKKYGVAKQEQGGDVAKKEQEEQDKKRIEEVRKSISGHGENINEDLNTPEQNQYLQDKIQLVKNMGELIDAFSNVKGLKGAEKFRNSLEVSRLLTDVLWNGWHHTKEISSRRRISTAEQIPEELGLRDKVYKLIGHKREGNNFMANYDGVRQDIENRINRSSSISTFFDELRPFGGVVTKDGRTYSLVDIKKGFQYAIENPSEPDNLRFITRDFGLRDKAGKLIEEYLKSRK